MFIFKIELKRDIGDFNTGVAQKTLCMSMVPTVTGEVLDVGVGNIFPITIPTPLPNCPFSDVVAYTCNTVRFFCPILHPILGSSSLLNDLFRFAYVKDHPLCSEVLQASDRYAVSCVHPYSVIENGSS